MTAAQLETLRLIQAHPGISQSELARQRHRAVSGIARIVLRLEHRGLVHTALEPAPSSGPCIRACYPVKP